MKQTILRKAVAFLSVLLLGAVSFAQNRPLTGKVVDKDGEPVVGAAVVVVGNSTI